MAQCAKTAPRIRQTPAHIPGIFGLLSEQPRRILHYKDFSPGIDGFQTLLSTGSWDGWSTSTAIAGADRKHMPFSIAFLESPADQKTSRMANCIWREVVTVCVIRPAEPIRLRSGLNNSAKAGTAKFGRLKMLKTSPRNSSLRRSSKGTAFKRPQSLMTRPGAVSTRDPMLPRKPGAAGTKQFGSKYRSGLPRIAECAEHPGAQSGRSGPVPKIP